MTDIGKFALVVPQEFKVHYDAHPFEITGLLQWARVFKGDVLTINADLSSYDTILTNVSSTENEYISIIRQMNPDAKIVCCFDYGFGIVNDYFLPGFERRIATVMGRADHVFSVNKNQVDWIRLMLESVGVDRPVHYIPHPSDLDNILQFRRPPDRREPDTVAVMWHQYDNYQIQPLLVLKAVERKLKKRLKKVLIGLKVQKMMELGIQTLAAGIPVIGDDHPEPSLRGRPLDPDLPKIVRPVPPGIAWDSVMPYLGVEPWYGMLSGHYAALDLYTVNSIGRFGIDCAGVGIPLVASRMTDSADLLYPFSRVNPLESKDAVRLLAKLLSDTEFYGRVEKTSLKNLRHYGFSESRARMMRMLDA